jgi:hypothetical protein
MENEEKMVDFTLRTYKKLLAELLQHEYYFQTFSEYIQEPANKVIILRHDVDARKENSLKFAEIESTLGIHGTYYFRIVPQSFNENVIRKIAELGHEIGYHYETMDHSNNELKISNVKFTQEELVDHAYEEFCTNLEKFRKITEIKTICMHGSPRSKFDNKDIWKKYDYRKLGIIGEPYFDLNFSEIYYITDTGRRWNGDNVSVRDKIKQPILHKNLNFHGTNEIIKAANENMLPDQMMLTFHPQRWTNDPILWIREFVWQNIKNFVKYFIVLRQESQLHLKT